MPVSATRAALSAARFEIFKIIPNVIARAGAGAACGEIVRHDIGPIRNQVRGFSYGGEFIIAQMLLKTDWMAAPLCLKR